MSDRRRTQRFVLGSPIPAEAISMQDVVVERIAGDLVTIVSLTPHEPGHETLIHVPAPGGPRGHRATVLSSTPISVGASVQFRVELRVAPQTDEDSTS
jgi:hypothetical protein